jgi:putative endonuclease
MYYTYILYSAKIDGYYIGYTGDSLDSRIYKHLHTNKGHTAKAKDWILVYSETYPTKEEAMARERQLKNWKNRTRLELLFQNNKLN